MKVEGKVHTKKIYHLRGTCVDGGNGIQELFVLANSLAEIELWADGKYYIYNIDILNHLTEIIVTNES